MSLGKLAYEQLKKGNLIFYEKDLMECGVDVEEASVVCTQIFKEHVGLWEKSKKKVFCFVHLSVQEFLAALYVYICLYNHREDVVNLTLKDRVKSYVSRTLAGFLKSTVDTVLRSENGNLDLFLRFLLGLSLESNQRLIEGLLTQATSPSNSSHNIVKHIKEKIRENPSAERCIYLFHCLNELNDKSLVEEMQGLMSSEAHSKQNLSPEQCSALAFVMLTSQDQNLDRFKLKDFSGTERALLRLLAVVKASTKANLSNINLTWRCCSGLASLLSSESSRLRELDLNHNGNLEVSGGMKLLCEGLGHPNC